MALLLSWRFWAAAISLVLLTVWSAFVYRAGGAHDREELADYKAAQAEQRLLADRARTIATTKALNDAHAQTVAADAAAASASDAAGRLRARVAELTRAARSGKGEQGADPIGVLADVLNRHDEAIQRISLYADRLRIAGIACERISDK